MSSIFSSETVNTLLEFLWAKYYDYVVAYPKTWCFILVAAVLFLSWRAFSRFSQRRATDRYKQLATEHQDKQRSKIDKFLAANALPNKRIFDSILNASVNDVVHHIKTGTWTAEEVVLTYCHRAAAVHAETNCLTEILFQEALERARELDSCPSKEGVLFGMPISIKDSVNIKDVPSSVGVFSWKDEKMSRNATIIECLLNAGAIPFCKTNVPQTMMSFECKNPLWGRTENPKLKGYSPGGSSGGEGALIGGGGSILGLGSDIGGSLRIPAHFSGLCALKPSIGRIPNSGSRSFLPTSLLTKAVNGPMGRCVDDLIPFMEACCGQPDIDIVPSNFSFRPVNSSTKLTFGVVRNLPFLGALPPCVRAVDDAVKALEAEGHRAVEFKFPFLTIDLVSLMYEALSADGGFYYKQALSDEPLEEILQPFIYLMSKSNFVLRIFSYLVSGYPDKRPMRFLNSLGRKDATKIISMMGERDRLTKKMNEAWSEHKIDFLVMPAFATPANLHDSFPNVSFAASYTFIWNILDYVAGIIPATHVDAEKDALHTPTSPEDIDHHKSSRLLEAELEYLYNPSKMAGLPIGVQIITPQYKELEALQAMKILESALKNVSSAK